MSVGFISRQVMPTEVISRQATSGLLLLLVAVGAAMATAAEPAPPADSVAAYLANWELDRSRWTPLEVAGPWDAARQ